jgi:phosphoribosylglycinamide formyltransferase-1
MTASCPVAVLISGRGTNMCALADQARKGKLPVDIRVVVSDRPDAPGLQLARERGIPTASLALRDFANREAFDLRLAEIVDGFHPELVVLAGYMKILSPAFVRQFTGRLLNIHPSLLPKYPGLHTHRRALTAQDRQHGASVHFVIEELDSGPIVIQGRVPVLPNDSEETLAARVQGAEHRIYGQAVEWYAKRRLVLQNGQAWLDGRPLPTPVIEDFDSERAP